MTKNKIKQRSANVIKEIHEASLHKHCQTLFVEYKKKHAEFKIIYDKVFDLYAAAPDSSRPVTLDHALNKEFLDFYILNFVSITEFSKELYASTQQLAERFTELRSQLIKHARAAEDEIDE